MLSLFQLFPRSTPQFHQKPLIYIHIYICRLTTEKQRDPLQITSKNGLQCVSTPLAPLSTLLIILWMSLLYIWLAGEFVKFKFFVCLHLYPHNLSIPIFFIVFCLSPSSSLFSVCLHLNPHFLSVSIFILIFCLSPSLSPFSVCLCLFLCFLSVTIFLIFSQSLCMRRHTKNEDKGRDSQKMRTEMETNRK